MYYLCSQIKMFMQNTEEWWHRMFEMHVKLMENFDAGILQEFKQELDTIPYTYAKPYEGLGIGASYVNEIAGWYDDVSKWSVAHEDYDAAVTYLERALDYYCDPVLDFDDDIVDEAKERMDKIVTESLVGIYKGSHEIHEYY